MTKSFLNDATRPVLPNGFIETRFGSLKRACDLGVKEGWGCPLSEIKRIEAYWELIDGDATAHGFVMELQDGRRAYLDYSMVFDPTITEHAEMVPMERERYPQLSGFVPGWSTNVDDLNRRLPAGVRVN